MRKARKPIARLTAAAAILALCAWPEPRRIRRHLRGASAVALARKHRVREGTVHLKRETA